MQSPDLVNYAVVQYLSGMAKATGTPKSARFTEDELPELEKAMKRGGGFKQVVLAGVRALNGNNDLTQDQVLAWIKRHTK